MIAPGPSGLAPCGTCGDRVPRGDLTDDGDCGTCDDARLEDRIERKGLVYGMPEDEYHGGPELSSTGMKRILDAPALYLHDRTHRTHKAAFDLGHVVHGMVLGDGLDVVRIDAESWRTKAAQTERDEARAEGKVAVLASEWAQARAMSDAVLTHPTARDLFDADADAEVSAFYNLDGVPVRCRFDLLHRDLSTIVDLKTSATADPRALARRFADFDYPLQAWLYLDALHALTGAAGRFLHVVVSSSAPHLVTVVELDRDALAVGEAKAHAALAEYREAVETGVWRGYATGVVPLSMPRWYGAELN